MLPQAAVGEFPDLNSIRRRMIRGPVNEFDKSTVVSIFPREIVEVKYTIEPGIFTVPAGSYEKPGILVVGTSVWWHDIDPKLPMLEIPVSSVQVADSIVKDYCNGIFCCNMGDTMPGLFYIPGVKTVDEIIKNYKSTLDDYKNRQRKFYSELVRRSDAQWSRSNGNPLSISDDARLAARELGLVSVKDWMKDFEKMEMVRCDACGSLKNPDYPVCSTCRAVDMNHPKAKNIKFAS